MTMFAVVSTLFVLLILICILGELRRIRLFLTPTVPSPPPTGTGIRTRARKGPPIVKAQVYQPSKSAALVAEYVEKTGLTVNVVRGVEGASLPTRAGLC